MLEYFLFKITGIILAPVPIRVCYFLAQITAYIAYLVSYNLRTTIARNIFNVVWPEIDPIKIRHIVRCVIKNTIKNYIDLILLPRKKFSELERCISVQGQDNFIEAIAKGKGVVLVTAHLGCFDVSAQILTKYSKSITILVEPLQPSVLLNYIISLRNCNGINVLPARSGALRIMLQSLRKGEVVLFACDRDITGDGVNASFFGKTTKLPSQAVKIAMRTGSCVVPVFNYRLDNDHYRIYVEPAIDLVRNGTGAVLQNIQQIAQVMENYIRERPEQWVVLSPIWED